MREIKSLFEMAESESEFIQVVEELLDSYGFVCKKLYNGELDEGNDELNAFHKTSKRSYLIKIIYNYHKDDYLMIGSILSSLERTRKTWNIRTDESTLVITNTTAGVAAINEYTRIGVRLISLNNLLYLTRNRARLQRRLKEVLPFTTRDVMPIDPRMEEFAETTQEDELTVRGEELINCIKEWNGEGKSTEYEKLCVDILDFLFVDDLLFLGDQVKSNRDTFRFDTDYSGAVKPPVRRTGNRLSGMRKPSVNSTGAAEPPVRSGESHLSGTDGATCNVVA